MCGCLNTFILRNYKSFFFLKSMATFVQWHFQPAESKEKAAKLALNEKIKLSVGFSCRKSNCLAKTLKEIKNHAYFKDIKKALVPEDTFVNEVVLFLKKHFITKGKNNYSVTTIKKLDNKDLNEWKTSVCKNNNVNDFVDRAYTVLGQEGRAFAKKLNGVVFLNYLLNQFAKEKEKEKHAHAKGKWKSAMKRVTWSQAAIHKMVQKLKLEQHQVVLKKILGSFQKCSAIKDKTTIYEADFRAYVGSLNVLGSDRDINQLYGIILKDWTQKQKPLQKFLIGLIEMPAENLQDWEKKGGAAKIAVEIARAINRIN